MSEKLSLGSQEVCELVLRVFQKLGDSQYGGEAVTQREHALQTAWLAEKANASPALITAALLHDIGHLLHALPDDSPEQGIDDRHEELGAHWLKRHFGSDVVEPVLLHVAAKRYLCAVDSQYQNQLSIPSQISLKLQGGPMSFDEVQLFESNPFAKSAVLLRQMDDAAKIAGLQTPSVEHFCLYMGQSIQKKSS